MTTLLDTGNGIGVGGMGGNDPISLAASSALPQPGMNPGNMTTMGPAPLQPPTPLPRFQPPEVKRAEGHFSTVGERKRADKDSLFHSIAGLIKSGGDYVQAKKNRMLQSSIERLLEAQQGLEEAKQNPNDPKSKEAIARNTAIINDITADPKINKQLQKAFNIDLFGGGKNKNENKALMDAWKSFGEKKKSGDTSALNPIAQRIMQNQPMRQQLDPQAQMQAQMIKAGLLPKAGELLKAQTEANKMLMEAKTAQDKIAATKQAAQVLADARKYGADKTVDAANVRSYGTQQAALIRFQADTIRVEGMLKAVQMRVDAMERIAKSKGGDKTVGNLAKEANIIKGRALDLAKKRKDAEDQLNKYAQSSGMWGKITGAVGMGQKSTLTKEQAQQLQKDIFTINLEQRSVEGQWKDLQQRTDTYVRMGQMPDPNDVPDDDGMINVTEEDMN